MTRNQYTPTLAKSPERPPCPDCGGKMGLMLLEPCSAGIEQRSFRCERCGYADAILLQADDRPAPPSTPLHR